MINKKWFFYLVVTILSGLILLVWSNWAMDDTEIFKKSTDSLTVKIVSVDNTDTTSVGSFESTIITCTAKVLSGQLKGETIKVYQEHNSQVGDIKIVEVGDKVAVKKYPIQHLNVEWAVENYVRIPTLVFLAILFMAFIIIFGRSKGLRTVISLLYTCIVVFAVFVPSVLSGKNIYVTAILSCIYMIVVTLLLVNGWDKKTLCATIGCVGGVLATAVITFVFSRVMKFTGFTDEHSYYLTMLPHPVNLMALSFSAILIGAVGAVMDVAMSMSSSLYELSEKVPEISFKSLVSSGFEIGKDMMGTMANTLVLAYVGSSLCSVLLLLTYSDYPSDIFNKEQIANEFLQAIAGSMGIILALPFTVFACGFIYLRHKRKNRDSGKIKV